MNRIVLIGNDYLAHGLKTSYEDFINWYCDLRVYGMVMNLTNAEYLPQFHKHAVVPG